MTISNNYAPDVSAGNGVTDTFSGSWNVIAAAYMVVQVQDTTTGAYTPYVLGSDYTLAFTASGYTITCSTIPATGYNIIRSRNVDLGQAVPFKTSTGFQGLVEENSFDKLTAITQDLQAQIDNTLLFPIGIQGITAPLLPVPQDGYGLVWSGTAGTLVNTTTSLATLEAQAAALYAIAANITTVAGISASVTSVAGNATNINTVAGISSNVTAVGSIYANVTTVAGISTNVTTVAGDHTVINTVAGDHAAIVAVNAALTAINAVAADLTNVDTVAGISANVTTVAGIHANVTTVAGISANVTAVAGDLTNIDACAADLTAINAAPAAATAAAASATAAAAIAAGIETTSTTSNTIGTGSQTFTVPAGLLFQAGQWATATDAANNANNMFCQVTSYSTTSLVLNCVVANGSGTKTSWNISLAGAQGNTGSTGASGSVPIGAAGGTADAITATITGVTLSDQQVCIVIPASDNATTTPTFAPNSLMAHTITKNGGAAVSAGDIKALRPAMLEYNLANTRWELMNPANVTYAQVTGATIASGASVSGSNTGDQTTVSGNAGTATKLATARAINGVNFDGSAAITIPGLLTYSTQTSTYAPTTTDNASVISFAGASGAATWTIAAGATNGNGWYAILSNPTLYYLTIKVTTNTIDSIAGATGFIMYPGEERLVQCDGTNYHSVILKGFYLKTTSSITFSVPPGYQAFDCEIWGGGGGGGAAATHVGGGGGGGYNHQLITAATMGSTTQTVTIGAGGGAATSGGETSIGSLVLAFGGGGAVSTTSGGGGGGGSPTAAGAVSVGSAGGAGGGVQSVSLAGTAGVGGANTNTDGFMGGGGSGGGTAGAWNGGSSISGWGGGGGLGGTATGTAGNSVYGGGGGNCSGSTGTAGTSVYGGNGGTGGTTTGGNGSVPGGGGQGGTTTAGTGGGGQVIIRGIT